MSSDNDGYYNGQEVYESYRAGNGGAIDSESLKIRLETRAILDRIKVFLEGKEYRESLVSITKEIEDEVTGESREEIIGQEIKVTVREIGTPKANNRGIQYLMFWLESKFNSQMALGNISEDQYGEYLYRCRISLIENLIINKYEYEMSTKDIREVISVLMEALEIYMSRPIRAGERESLTRTLKTIDSHTTTPMGRKKLFGLF